MVPQYPLLAFVAFRDNPPTNPRQTTCRRAQMWTNSEKIPVDTGRVNYFAWHSSDCNPLLLV